jgi:hypothetical protein
MASLQHWNRPETDDAWDTVILGGMFMPGVARVSVKIDSDLDTKKPKGAKLASIHDKGDKPSRVEIELILEDDEDLDLLEAQLVNLRPRSRGAGRGPVEIQHPNPNFWGITAVTVDNVDAPHPDPVDGWRIQISCLEWAPEPIAVMKGKGKEKPKGDTDVGTWGPFLDDDVAGSGAPAANDSAIGNSDLHDSRAD